MIKNITEYIELIKLAGYVSINFTEVCGSECGCKSYHYKIDLY
jgi:hypothetical protein